MDTLPQKETIIQIDAPHFCASIVAAGGKVKTAAPILKYMVGWNGPEVANYCRFKKWTWRKAS